MMIRMSMVRTMKLWGRDLAWQPPLYCPLHLRHLDGDDNDLLISPVKMGEKVMEVI